MESDVAARTKRTGTAANVARVHWECWFWAIGFLSVFVIITMLRFHAADNPVDEFNVFNNARLERFAAHPAPYKVIMLGDSRLKYATLADDELAALAANADASVAFLRIVQNQAQFSDFEPLVDNILHSKPDLLILQKSLLTRHRHNTIEVRKLQKFVVWALIDGAGAWNSDGLDPRGLQFDTPCTNAEPLSLPLSDQQFGAAVAEVKKRGVPDAAGPNAEAARAFIAAARSAGTKVVVLGVPATPAYWQIIAAAFPGIADPIPDGVEEWRYPGNYVASDYCDLLHLLPGARAKHSQWLADRTVRDLIPREEGHRIARSRDARGTE